MTEFLLIMWLGVSNIALVYFWLEQRAKNKNFLKLFDIIVGSLQAQRGINEKQNDINETLGTNLEILGVHTKLIPPSIAMQAEAFLAWHNKRKEEKDNG